MNKPTRKVSPPKHTQLTYEGNIYFYEDGQLWDMSQISPDGQFTAYVADIGSESIYVRDNSGEQAIEIFKGLKGVISLRWSPNGNEILFTSTFDNSSHSSYIIPKLGGRAQQLKTNPYGCWSPDGNLIAGSSLSFKEINITNRQTDEVVKTIQPGGFYTFINDLDWCPIGDKLLFVTQDDSSGKDKIWTIKTDGTQQQKIFEANTRINCPRWSADGNYIYYLQSKGMTQDLMKIKVSSTPSDQLPIVGEPVYSAWFLIYQG